MVAQTNHQLSKYATKNKVDTSDLFTNGENYRGKTPLGEFKVTTPKNLLLSKQAVKSNHLVNLRSPLPRIYYYQNKRLKVKEFQYLIPTYS